jgi:hypothetical protein
LKSIAAAYAGRQIRSMPPSQRRLYSRDGGEPNAWSIAIVPTSLEGMGTKS